MKEGKGLCSRIRRAPIDSVVEAASKIGLDQLAMEITEHDQGMGSPHYFGRTLKAIRAAHGISQDDWAERIAADKTRISKIEQGVGPLPTRRELLLWGPLQGLPDDEIDDLMIAAGYWPETGLEHAISGPEHRAIHAGTRALLGRSGSRADVDALAFWASQWKNRLRVTAKFFTARAKETGEERGP